MGTRVDLDTQTSHIERDAKKLVGIAHKHHVKVILDVFGTADFFEATDAHRVDSFTRAIAALVARYDYDGVNIDWEGQLEPLRYRTFVLAMRPLLQNIGALRKRELLLTAFFGGNSVAIATQNHRELDQIHVSCYDNYDYSFHLVWHNAALRDPSSKHGRYGCDALLESFASSGIPRDKLGVGVPFYGKVWRGGSDQAGNGPYYPGQTLVVPAHRPKQIWYRNIARDSDLSLGTHTQRDLSAGAVPYITRKSGTGSVFVSYEDPTSIREKWKFVRENGYAGVFVWMIGMDYSPTAPPGEQHPLANALLSAAGL